MRLITAILGLSLCAFAQNNQQENQLFYNGSGAVQYICTAPSQVGPSSYLIADTSLTNIVVSSNVATATTAANHGLWVGATFTISGSTPSALNAKYSVATVPTGTTFTFTTSGVSDGTYTPATLIIATSAPLLTKSVWSILISVYNGSGQLVNTHHADPSASQSFALICANRANYN